MNDKYKTLNVYIGAEQMKMLDKLSNVSLKSKAVLVREALELLFRSPGGKR
jgi:predicted DNA-binding protein